MSSFLFEQPLRLLFTCLFLLGISGVISWVSQLQLWRRITLAGIVVTALLFTLNVKVETEQEEMRGFVGMLFQQVTQQRLGGLLDLVDPGYNYDEVTYEMLVTAITTRWKRYSFTSFQLRKWSYEKREKGTYDIQFACKAWISFGDGGSYPIEKTEWRLRIRRTEGKKVKWQIEQIEPIELTLPLMESGDLSLKRLLRTYR
ncbi:MAG: hypothetical protein EP343_28800 [Deltaproteobacteria bacterium]|nr:MAG: hypothetical protein EP343_28800 [Deltaproteobacteria bacterium]